MNREPHRSKCLEENREECRFCGSTEAIVVHHIDGDESNGEVDNLVPLCKSCHQGVHHGLEGFEELSKELPNRPYWGKSEQYSCISLSEDTADELFEVKKRQGREWDYDDVMRMLIEVEEDYGDR
jgi:hypothetical protein